MAKAELKTKANELSVADFLSGQDSEQRRADCAELDAILRRVTGHEPKMWGPSIVGYGSYHYKYDSGREGTMCRAGFSPRKAALTLYLMGNYVDCQAEVDGLLARLGKHSTGKGCLYIKKLADVDLAVLERLAEISWNAMNTRYPD